MYYTYVDTPIGPFMLAGSDTALSAASFPRGDRRREPASGWIEARAPLAAAAEQIEEYFAGARRAFDLELAVEGTRFQRRVWRALRSIPFGELRSYGELAREIGRPGASRAVGAANGANPLPLVVPCHRVVGADGSLTGFGGGLETKRWLLEFEGATPAAAQRELF